MRVIIPNYLQMSSNCLVPSEYYAICCIDRCESMMAHLEREIQAPHATAERILGLVSALASDSVAANRTLPAALVRKLEDVAVHHGGVVPLHGRLFAQWMHYAYPRECVYPHVSNTTGGMSAAEWQSATGMRSSLKKEEVAAFAETLPKAADAQPCDSEDGEGCMDMWVPEEELVDAVHWQAARVVQQEPAAFSVRQVRCDQAGGAEGSGYLRGRGTDGRRCLPWADLEGMHVVWKQRCLAGGAEGSGYLRGRGTDGRRCL